MFLFLDVLTHTYLITWIFASIVILLSSGDIWDKKFPQSLWHPSSCSIFHYTNRVLISHLSVALKTGRLHLRHSPQIVYYYRVISFFSFHDLALSRNKKKKAKKRVNRFRILVEILSKCCLPLSKFFMALFILANMLFFSPLFAMHF